MEQRICASPGTVDSHTVASSLCRQPDAMLASEMATGNLEPWIAHCRRQSLPPASCNAQGVPCNFCPSTCVLRWPPVIMKHDARRPRIRAKRPRITIMKHDARRPRIRAKRSRIRGKPGNLQNDTATSESLPQDLCNAHWAHCDVRPDACVGDSLLRQGLLSTACRVLLHGEDAASRPSSAWHVIGPD